MQRLIVECGVFSLVVFTAIVSRADTKAEVLEATKTYDAAIGAKDVGALVKLFDDMGHFVNEQGKVNNKREHIAEYVDAKRTWESAESSEKEITVLSDTAAIETGTFLGTGTLEGKPFRMNSRYMDVWVKKNGRWVVVAELATAIRVGALSESDAKKVDVIKVTQEYDQAILTQDAEAFERLLSDDFVLIDFDGKSVTKDEVVSEAKAGTTKFEVAKSENSVVRFHGDTAIWNGDWIENGVAKGEPVDRKGRFATTLVKSGGQWKIVSDQVTEIKAK